MEDRKRQIVIHVADAFSKQNGGMSAFTFPYDECDVKVRKIGDKWMFLVFEEKTGKSLLSIDVNMVTAIEYGMVHNSFNFCV